MARTRSITFLAGAIALVVAALAVAEELLVQRQQLQVDGGAARLALPSTAAMHISCMARGATFAVTLTLPLPPSSIRATAVGHPRYTENPGRFLEEPRRGSDVAGRLP